MVKIRRLNELSIIQLSHVSYSQLIKILTSPFHDEAETQQAWDKLQCELWFMSSLSDLPRDSDDNAILERALTYTEFEDELDYGAVLILSIVEDSGKGIYLLMPKTLLTELRQYFSIEND